MKQAGFFDVSERRKKLVKTRDLLERTNRFAGWEGFRPELDKALARKARDKGGSPPFDAVLMFKGLNDLLRRDLDPRSSRHKGIFFEVSVNRRGESLAQKRAGRTEPGKARQNAERHGLNAGRRIGLLHLVRALAARHECCSQHGYKHCEAGHPGFHENAKPGIVMVRPQSSSPQGLRESRPHVQSRRHTCRDPVRRQETRAIAVSWVRL